MNEQSDPKEDVDNTGRGREFLLESGFYDEGIEQECLMIEKLLNVT
jgi:hypothetical protein